MPSLINFLGCGLARADYIIAIYPDWHSDGSPAVSVCLTGNHKILICAEDSQDQDSMLDSFCHAWIHALNQPLNSATNVIESVAFEGKPADK